MRSNGFQITGNELQAMVNEHILGAKTAIPATTRCLTRAEVLSCVYVYAGPQDPPVATIPFTTWPIGGGVYQVGADPNLTCSYEYINPLPANGTIVFEMNQIGNPYLNCDLFAQVNGSPLRLDPGNSLDGMFFGGPQYSANMASAVKIGNQITIQANFGLDNPESAGNYGWNGNGYGVLEIYRNSTLISNQSTVYRAAIFSPNATQLAYSFIVESGVNYYVKAYPYIDNRIRATVNWASNFCDACNNASGQISVVGNESTFCASTSFTSSNFNSFPAGNYILSYGGNAVNISTNGTSTATMYGGGCTACIGTTPNWAVWYQNCDGCVTRDVYKDINSCSATYGKYKINADGAVITTGPANTGACDTAQNWQNNNTTVCIDCTNVTVYRNNNPCSSNYHFYRYTNPTTSATITQETDPSGSACVTSPNWVFKYYNCSSCNTRSVERDENPCSDTYLGYTVDHGVHVGTVAPANTGSCSTAAQWTIAFSSYSCDGCDKYYNEIDLNSCSSTSGQLRRSSVLAESNSTYCGGSCGQSTAADWTIAFGSYGCVGCDKYYMEVDLNQYSATYQQTRVSGAVAEYSSSYCCSPDPCIQYNVNDYGWVYYTDCLGHFYSQYMNPWDSFCATSVSANYVYSSGDCGNLP